MVTYDTPNIAKQKANWIKENNLGGALFWEVSADKTGDESLVGTVAREFGKLEDSMNHLSYPKSVYKLLRDGQVTPFEESTTKVGPIPLTSTSTFTSSAILDPSLTEIQYEKWSIDVEITDAEWWLHTRGTEEKRSHAEEAKNVKETRDGAPSAMIRRMPSIPLRAASSHQ
jgi:chitinase